MIDEIAADLRAVIIGVEGLLPQADIDDAWELVDAGEYGVSLENLCAQLYEYDVQVPALRERPVRAIGLRESAVHAEQEVRTVRHRPDLRFNGAMSSFPPPDASWDPHYPATRSPGHLLPAEERNWSVAAHAGSFVTAWFLVGFVAPLLVLLIRGPRSPFVRRHAVESLNFQLNALAYSAILTVLVFMVVGLVLLPLVPIYVVFYAICVVLGSVRASHGEDFRYPLTIRFVS